MVTFNFDWIRVGELGVSARPWGVHELLQARELGIGAVVSLTETPLHPSELEECGLAWLHLPVPDFTAPTHEQIRAFTEFVEEQTTLGNAVLVHCASGFGRSGTLAACHLVNQGLDASQALAEIRELRPGSVETPEQEQAIHAWADHIRTRSQDPE